MCLNLEPFSMSHFMSHSRTVPSTPSIHYISVCVRVDKPHPASGAGTLPAVAGCAKKDVAQVIWNGIGQLLASPTGTTSSFPRIL